MKKTKEQRRSDKKHRDEARARAKERGPKPVAASLSGSRFDQLHLLECSKEQIERAASLSEPDDVIVVADSRDSVARPLVLRYARLTELELRAKEAPHVAADLVPTFHLVVPLVDAVDVMLEGDPGVSETLRTERLPEDERFVLVVAAEGVLLARHKIEQVPDADGTAAKPG